MHVTVNNEQRDEEKGQAGKPKKKVTCRRLKVINLTRNDILKVLDISLASTTTLFLTPLLLVIGSCRFGYLTFFPASLCCSG